MFGTGEFMLPAGVGFDAGGIGKGLAADLVAEQLVDAGATWVLVSLGGDLRVAGEAIAADGIRIEIEDPADGSRSRDLTIRGGGVATSSVRKRRWLEGERWQHHLLDNATGRPADTRRAAVTVHASEAWWADCVASVLTAHDDLGPETVDDYGVEAIAVLQTGELEDLRLGELQPIGPSA